MAIRSLPFSYAVPDLSRFPTLEAIHAVLHLRLPFTLDTASPSPLCAWETCAANWAQLRKPTAGAWEPCSALSCSLGDHPLTSAILAPCRLYCTVTQHASIHPCQRLCEGWPSNSHLALAFLPFLHAAPFAQG